MSKRQMVLVGFLQAQNCSNYPASWRHPESATDFLTADYYQRIARILEAGKFHLAFFDDRLALPDIYGGDHAEAVRNGVRVVKMDPIPILTMMGGGDHAARAGRDLLDHLLPAVSRGAHVLDPRSHERRPGGLERRDLAQRFRGRELRRGQGDRP